MSVQRLRLLILLTGAVLTLALNDNVANLHQECMRCLCQAASGCYMKKACSEGYCGPFALSRSYWTDAGQQVLPDDDPSQPESFEACAKDFNCATGVVRAYMANFAQDCNGDGEVNCDDFAMIHYNGGYDCGTNLTNEFGRRYFKCRSLFTEVVEILEDVDDACLQCLCQDRTGCDASKTCQNGMCGPFAITGGYWADSGKRVIAGDNPESEGAFERCAEDSFCAAGTVRSFYKKYGKVPRNGPAMCEDLAVKHIYGRFNSRGVPDPKIQKIVDCYSKTRS